MLCEFTISFMLSTGAANREFIVFAGELIIETKPKCPGRTMLNNAPLKLGGGVGVGDGHCWN